jgi:hypothetical protein
VAVSAIARTGTEMMHMHHSRAPDLRHTIGPDIDRSREMNPLMKSLVAFCGALLAGIVLAAMMGAYAGSGSNGVQQECASLAWRVANRNHSILDSAAFRQTESQAYLTCIRDPGGFDRLVRKGL